MSSVYEISGEELEELEKTFVKVLYENRVIGLKLVDLDFYSIKFLG